MTATCTRCRQTTERFVEPYWSRAARLCPGCCHHIAALLDLRDRWPPVPEYVWDNPGRHTPDDDP